jgi:diguanylate cyclase (GGDEF)-like protein
MLIPGFNARHLLRRFGLTALAMAIPLFLAAQTPAQLAPLELQKQTELLADIAHQDSATAQRELALWRSQTPGALAYLLEREYLKVRIQVEFDAAKLDTAGQLTEQLAKLAQANNEATGLVLATAFEARLLNTSGKARVALVKLKSTADIAVTGVDPDALRRYHTAFSNALVDTGQQEAALPHLLSALGYSEQMGIGKQQARAEQLTSLASLYDSLKNPEKSLMLVDEGLALARSLGARKRVVTSLLIRGVALANLNRLAESAEAYTEALKISQDAGMLSQQATALLNLADLQLVAKNYVKAAELARHAVIAARAAGNFGSETTAMVNVGFALMGQGKTAEGAAQVHSVLDALRAGGYIADMEGILDELSVMYERAGLPLEALKAVREQQKLSVQIFKADQSRVAAEMQEEFDSVQRQKKIDMLAQDNALKDSKLSNQKLQQTVTLLAGAVMVLAAIFIYMLYRRARRTNIKLREVNELLEFHSVRDPLTGLHNRRSFLELMKRRQTDATSDRVGDRRDDGAAPQDGLMIMDIDHFKHINDTWGHAAGDAVLVEISNRLRKAVRDSDMVMRWGGEEFLVYSPKANALHLQKLAQRLLAGIASAPVEVGPQAIPVSITAGFIALPFSDLPESRFNWEKAMSVADAALYMGKLGGRNRAYGVIRLTSDSPDALATVEQDLAKARDAGLVELLEILGPPIA